MKFPVAWLGVLVLGLGILGCGGGEDAAGGAGAGGAAGTGGSAGTGGATTRGLSVETVQGAVEGVAQDGVYVYRGLPFASPPVGDLRWRPPVAPENRADTLMATTVGRPCLQNVPILGETGDEDCLYLNITTPAEGGDLPVMVWIHGGAFILGEGAQTDGGTLGDKISRQTPTVVVTINYRLGSLGFLAHSSLGVESPQNASGNYGLMDQVAALEWVRDNISGFGGDPNNVTIFGESAGAFSVCAHLASTQSTGLFHKAIAQSGNCQQPYPSRAAAETHGDRYAEKIGCDQASDILSCMRAKTGPEALGAFVAGANFGFADLEGEGAMWGPIVDGLFMDAQPAERISSGNFNQVPVMAGFTKDEAQLFAWLAETDATMPVPVTDANYNAFVALLLGGDPTLVSQARAQYPTPSDGNSPYAAPAEALGALATDAIFRCPGRDEVAALAQNVTTYLYQFEYEDAAFQLDAFMPRPPYGLGAFHSADIQYVFGVPSSITSTDFAPGPDEELWNAMLGYWTRFAATGDPNGDGAPMWPTWTAETDAYLVLDTTVQAGAGAALNECAFWADKDYLFSAL